MKTEVRKEQWKGEANSWPKDALGPFPPERSLRAHDCRTEGPPPGKQAELGKGLHSIGRVDEGARMMRKDSFWLSSPGSGVGAIFGTVYKVSLVLGGQGRGGRARGLDSFLVELGFFPCREKPFGYDESQEIKGSFASCLTGLPLFPVPPPPQPFVKPRQVGEVSRAGREPGAGKGTHVFSRPCSFQEEETPQSRFSLEGRSVQSQESR